MALSCDLNECYDEREIDDKIITQNPNNNLPTSENCKTKIKTIPDFYLCNLSGTKNLEIQLNNQNKNDSQTTNDSSTCSISSSSSLYYETRVGLYHNQRSYSNANYFTNNISFGNNIFLDLLKKIIF